MDLKTGGVCIASWLVLIVRMASGPPTANIIFVAFVMTIITWLRVINSVFLRLLYNIPFGKRNLPSTKVCGFYALLIFCTAWLIS